MRTLADYADMINAALPAQLKSLGSIPPLLLEAMSYSLEAGGKRLRPALLLAACDMLGGSVETAMPFACALEMIHTYSLIHDDLPAMDNDDYRRGRLTNHKVYGEGMAILAGDGLLHAAMELMLRAAAGMNDLRGARAAEAIARRCGVTGMVAGQVMDVTGEGKAPTQEAVEYIHLHKTADLLTAPMEAGLILAGADAAQVEAGIAYGQHMGLAFQMMDDLLDVVGNAELLGKQTGMDAQRGKMTWIAIRGIDGTRADAAYHTQLACDAMAAFGDQAKFFITLAQSTLERVQ